MNHADSLTADELNAMDMYWRAANYLAAAQIYLRDNCLLEDSLKPEHIKPRLLGHWGTVPGINFIYTHLNRLVRQRHQSVLLVTGPGHGAPANLANLYLEGTLAEFYPELTQTKDGVAGLVSQFSMPGGFPSHLTPATPGCALAYTRRDHGTSENSLAGFEIEVRTGYQRLRKIPNTLSFNQRDHKHRRLSFSRLWDA